MRLVSAADATVDWARPRLRPGAFLVRMWLLNALARLNLPEAVFLKRLAAPLWVFSFGIEITPWSEDGRRQTVDVRFPAFFRLPSYVSRLPAYVPMAAAGALAFSWCLTGARIW